MTDNIKFETLTDGLQQYVETHSDLLKLEAVERSSVIGSSLISGLLIGIVGAFTLLFVSLWAAFCLSAYIGDNYSGFLVVAGFYFLLLLLLLIARKKLIEIPLRDRIVRKFFKE